MTVEVDNRMKFLNDEVRDLRVLKYDLVDDIVDLKLLLNDLPEDLKPLTIETLRTCPVWFLLREKEILARRAGIIPGALLKGLKQCKTGFFQLSYKEKAMIFAHEAVAMRKKARRVEVDFNGILPYKIEMIQKVVELQILLGDIPEASQAQAEKKYMEDQPWSYEYFKELLGELNDRADTILTGFYSGLKKEQQKRKFKPRNRISGFLN